MFMCNDIPIIIINIPSGYISPSFVVFFVIIYCTDSDMLKLLHTDVYRAQIYRNMLLFIIIRPVN